MNPPGQHRDPRPRGRCPYTDDGSLASINETVRRMFDNFFHGLQQQYHQLGWGSSSGNVTEYGYNFGSSMGQIVNDAEKFAVEVDVSQFRPEDLKVTLRHDELTIEGHQSQQRDQYGSIERHFVRRYTLPDDVDDSTLTSNFRDNGILSVTARKKNVPPTTPTRNIPIQTHSGREQRSGTEQRSGREQSSGTEQYSGREQRFGREQQHSGAEQRSGREQRFGRAQRPRSSSRRDSSASRTGPSTH